MTTNQLCERMAKKANEMSLWRGYEPSLAEILSDSMTRALMRADGVKPQELETMLRQIGFGLASDIRSGRERPTECR